MAIFEGFCKSAVKRFKVGIYSQKWVQMLLGMSLTTS